MLMAMRRRLGGNRKRLAISLGALMLGSLSGCQWCPKGAENQVGRGAEQAPMQERPGDSRTDTAPASGRTEPQQALQDAERGQQAMVQCLQSERALTDGNELRCEDWKVIRDEFLKP